MSYVITITECYGEHKKKLLSIVGRMILIPPSSQLFAKRMAPVFSSGTRGLALVLMRWPVVSTGRSANRPAPVTT